MKNIRDSFKTYSKDSQNPLDIKEYVNIANLYNKFLIDKVLEGEEVSLPYRLGSLSVRGKKQEVRFEDGKIVGLAPDWVKTKKLWEEDAEAKNSKRLLYHTNEHTDGVRYKYNWSKNRVLVTNKTLYNFRLTRTNKRRLSDLVKNGKKFITLER